MEKLTAATDVHVEEIAIETTDAVPTYLENEGAGKMGEDLVHIYDTPSNTDKDPSLWVLVSFAFFFAFIVGDGGYGLVFLAIALYFRYKLPGIQGVKKRFLKLCTLLCLSCIAWGFLTHSFFGINFSPDNPVRKWSLLQWLIEKKAEYHISHQDEVYTYWVNKYPSLAQEKDPAVFVRGAASVNLHGEVSYDLLNKFTDNILLEMALFVGVIHLILGMGRYLDRQWTGIGWILVIIGCYLYFPHYLGATSIFQYVFGIDRAQAGANGPYLMIGGFILAVLLSIIKNKWLGILEVTAFIQVFADVMSYLRLYALGLAGAMVTNTLNEVVSVLPVAVAILLLIGGHIVNMGLSVMGGIIHGLRLNFLEWYHYSFEGGGKPFNPLKKLYIE
jgi:V/A-type H+-transporting ATPase subunit I